MEGELWEILYAWVTAEAKLRPRQQRVRYGDWVILLVVLWAALHDRPLSWACRPESWGGEERVPWESLNIRGWCPALEGGLSRRYATAGRLPTLFPRALPSGPSFPMPVNMCWNIWFTNTVSKSCACESPDSRFAVRTL